MMSRVRNLGNLEFKRTLNFCEDGTLMFVPIPNNSGITLVNFELQLDSPIGGFEEFEGLPLYLEVLYFGKCFTRHKDDIEYSEEESSASIGLDLYLHSNPHLLLLLKCLADSNLSASGREKSCLYGKVVIEGICSNKMTFSMVVVGEIREPSKYLASTARKMSKWWKGINAQKVG